jgi:glutamyl-tRNA synthetase/nondiscriminating glutamyl-tRNA synthetase
MGVLPEALVNYLALLGWAPTGGTREIFRPEELVKEFSLKRVTPSPAVFDMEKLYWLNRHYIKEASPARIDKLAFSFYERELTTELAKAHGLKSTDRFAWGPPPPILDWLAKVNRLLVPYVDRLDQLPERTSLIFKYDAKAALAAPDNAEVLSWPNTNAVFAGFIFKILEDESAKAGTLAPERFKQVVNEVKAETGAKGKELFHPIRMMITGSHSGPDFDKLIPILEEGSHLQLPKHVLSVHERVQQFAQARGSKS